MSSRRIGNYLITDYVGSGGFGSVFKAEDVSTPGRVVAIKELHRKHTRNPVIKQRFFQEAVAMARLDHPNLPRLYTFGEDNGSYYLVMEFISGKLLSDEMRETGQMRPDRAVAVLTQVLDAVNYAHHNGIIHRDLKPDNIILVDDDSSLRIKVLDFGIARMVGGENLTIAGEGFGTPAYMAPERMTGAGGDDPRMDLYAAGIILFEMLTGKAPFESKASDPAIYWVEMRELHQRGPLPALAPLGVPAEVERVAMRATAKRLEDRYQSADEMLGDLRGLCKTSTDAPTVVLNSSRLLVSTTPGGAEVYVDDLLRGTSDAIRGRLLLDGLSSGLHRVRVLKEGFNEYTINVALEEGQQTDLQVAIPARPTVAMPPAENTAAGGLDTLKIQGSDEIKTAMLVVENLPAGSTLFIGSEPVAHVGPDGRATLKLTPGSHEIRATAPTGATATSVVSITAQETGALKTMSLPLAQPIVAGTRLSEGLPGDSRRGKQLAAAAVVILLLALAAAAYFVLQRPDRNREPVTAVSVAPAALGQESPSAAQASEHQPSAEDQKKAVDGESQKQQEAAAIEPQKKAAETKGKPDKQSTSSEQPTAPVTIPAPPISAPPVARDPVAEPGRGSTGPGSDGCLLVTVVDANNEPIGGARVIVQQTGLRGRTGPKGHWQECGLTPGQSIRVGVLGPRGGLLGSQTAVIASRTFITIRIPRTIEERPQLIPNRRRPFQRRP